MAQKAHQGFDVAAREVEATMPYVDINPHRQRPKWLSYVGLSVLLLLAVLAVIFALARA
ncbi:hypothetical protein [Arthrobacter gyeryongensis]|uniref:hypothetical protein n=1 Tax=Arthrobacter gyeryongensis TaxID=1650592 RepID=UPI003CD058B8